MQLIVDARVACPHVVDALAQRVDVADESVASLHEAIERQAQAAHVLRVDRHVIDHVYTHVALLVVVVVAVRVVSATVVVVVVVAGVTAVGRGEGVQQCRELFERRGVVQAQLVLADRALDLLEHLTQLVAAFVLHARQLIDMVRIRVQSTLAERVLFKTSVMLLLLLVSIFDSQRQTETLHATPLTFAEVENRLAENVVAQLVLLAPESLEAPLALALRVQEVRFELVVVGLLGEQSGPMFGLVRLDALLI